MKKNATLDLKLNTTISVQVSIFNTISTLHSNFNF